MNELLYKLMRQQGVVISIDENIGIEFMNMNDGAP